MKGKKKICFLIIILICGVLSAKETKITDKIAVDSCGTCAEWLKNHLGYILPSSILPFTSVAVATMNICWNNYIEYKGHKYDIPKVEKRTIFLIFEYGVNICCVPVTEEILKFVLQLIELYDYDENDIYKLFSGKIIVLK